MEENHDELAGIKALNGAMDLVFNAISKPIAVPSPLPAKCCGRCNHWGKDHARPTAAVAYCNITGVLGAKEEGTKCFLFGLDVEEVIPNHYYCPGCHFIFSENELDMCDVCGESVCGGCMSDAQASEDGGTVCCECYDKGRRE
jgi:hypothetical protein